MANFFISYSHSDRPFVKDLIPQMRTVFRDKSVWFDDAIPGGTDWWTTILTEIDQCELFIFLFSDEAAASTYCQDELREAIRLDKRILPIIVRPLRADYPGQITDDLGVFLKATQYIDLSSGMSDTSSVPKLWGDILQLLGNPDREVHTQLTRAQRWLLANQFDILSKLEPHNKDYYQGLSAVVEKGYELHYDWITSYIYDGDETMKASECLEVFDILEMFDFLERSYENLIDKIKIAPTSITFAGFDGNRKTETKYMTYTQYLVEEENRFSGVVKNNRYNSHFPTLDRYRAMVQEWKNSRDQHNLSEADLIRIASIGQI